MLKKISTNFILFIFLLQTIFPAFVNAENNKIDENFCQIEIEKPTITLTTIDDAKDKIVDIPVKPVEPPVRPDNPVKPATPTIIDISYPNYPTIPIINLPNDNTYVEPISIIYTDDKNSEIFHKNLKVEIINLDGEETPTLEIEIWGTTKSSTSWEIFFENVPSNFQITNQKISEWFFIKNTEIFVIEKDKEGDFVVKITVDKIKSSFKYILKDKDTGENLPWVNFILKNEKWVEIDKKTTDNSGSVFFESLRYGNYSLIQEDVLEGYKKSEEIKILKNSFSINSYKIDSIFNEKIKKDVILKVFEQDSENKIPLKEWIFKVWRYYSNSNSENIFQKIPYGDYEISFSNLNNYVLINNPENIKKSEFLDENQTIEREFIFRKKENNFKITISDLEDENKKLEWVNFILKDKNGKEISKLSSNKDWEIMFEKQKFWDYTIEKEDFEGYQDWFVINWAKILTLNIFQKDFKNDWEDLVFDLKNEKIKKNIILKIFEKKENKNISLKSWKFQIWEKILENQTWILTFDKINYWEYSVSLAEKVKWFNLISTIEKIEKSEFKNPEISREIFFERIKKDIKVKVFDENWKWIKSKCFILKYNWKEISAKITDENGELNFWKFEFPDSNYEIIEKTQDWKKEPVTNINQNEFVEIFDKKEREDLEKKWNENEVLILIWKLKEEPKKEIEEPKKEEKITWGAPWVIKIETPKNNPPKEEPKDNPIKEEPKDYDDLNPKDDKVYDNPVIDPETGKKLPPRLPRSWVEEKVEEKIEKKETPKNNIKKFAKKLPKTWAVDKVWVIKNQKNLDISLPSKETFRLAWSWETNLNVWLDILPERDRKNNKFIILPKQGLVMPVNSVSENEKAYKNFINGKEENFEKYLVNGSVQLPWTSKKWFWEAGNKVIWWHSSYWFGKSNYRTHFQKIIEMENNDEIWIFEKQKNWEFKRFVYKVEKSYNTKDSDVSILKASNEDILTLFTCTPIWGVSGRWIVKSKFIWN